MPSSDFFRTSISLSIEYYIYQPAQGKEMQIQESKRDTSLNLTPEEKKHRGRDNINITKR